MTREITREELSEAGIQYGHQTKRWNPKMAPYIYGVKNKNHVIDLEKTIVALNEVATFVESVAKADGKILFVGTKRNAKPAVKEAALRTGNFYINNRWLGGTLTNMKTISSRIKTLLMIENDEKTGQLSLRPKKEQILIQKEKAKLETALGGIKQMHKLPAALFVVDPQTDEIAVKEARKLNIPVIAIADTNANPDMIDYLIPGNDDLQEAINLITNFIVEVYAEAANITLAPSVLRTKLVKKEYPADQRNDRNFNNNNRPDRQRNYKKNSSVDSKTDQATDSSKETTKTVPSKKETNEQ